MKRLWNKLLDWIVKLKFPFYFDDHFSTVAWRWHGGYGRESINLPPFKPGEWYVFVHPDFQETMERLLTEEIIIGQAFGL